MESIPTFFPLDCVENKFLSDLEFYGANFKGRMAHLKISEMDWTAAKNRWLQIWVGPHSM